MRKIQELVLSIWPGSYNLLKFPVGFYSKSYGTKKKRYKKRTRTESVI